MTWYPKPPKGYSPAGKKPGLFVRCRRYLVPVIDSLLLLAVMFAVVVAW